MSAEGKSEPNDPDRTNGHARAIERQVAIIGAAAAILGGLVGGVLSYIGSREVAQTQAENERVLRAEDREAARQERELVTDGTQRLMALDLQRSLATLLSIRRGQECRIPTSDMGVQIERADQGPVAARLSEANWAKVSEAIIRSRWLRGKRLGDPGLRAQDMSRYYDAILDGIQHLGEDVDPSLDSAADEEWRLPQCAR